MPKFYCEYCGIYLTHSSPSGRKQHSKGKKHETARQDYYRAVMQDLVEQLQSCFQKNMIPTFISRDTIRRLLIKHQQDFAGISTTAFVETIESLRLGAQMQAMMPPQMGGMMPFGAQGMLPPQGLPHMINQGPPIGGMSGMGGMGGMGGMPMQGMQMGMGQFGAPPPMMGGYGK